MYSINGIFMCVIEKFMRKFMRYFVGIRIGIWFMMVKVEVKVRVESNGGWIGSLFGNEILIVVANE